MESTATMQNQFAPAFTTRSARSFCSTRFVNAACDVPLSPMPGLDMNTSEYTVWRGSSGHPSTGISRVKQIMWLRKELYEWGDRNQQSWGYAFMAPVDQAR